MCRIVTFSPVVEKKEIWYNFVKTNFLNIISVSVYYSNRYNNSDNFLNFIQTVNTVNKINFLKEKNNSDIVNNFIDDIKIIKINNSEISLKEMHYLWKIFLNKNDLPYIIFISTAMKELKQKFEFKNNRFLNVKSPYLENIKILNSFWKDFMVNEQGEELEVSELCDLYNNWIQLSNEDSLENFLIDEDFFINYISNFCDIDVKGKIIENFRCILWEKKNETKSIIEDLKLKYKYNENLYENSIDSLYADYCNTCKNEYNYKIVSKNWFSKYINQVIPEKYINKNRILNDFWKN
jgi:predicted N-acyltransferase